MCFFSYFFAVTYDACAHFHFGKVKEVGNIDFHLESVEGK